MFIQADKYSFLTGRRTHPSLYLIYLYIYTQYIYIFISNIFIRAYFYFFVYRFSTFARISVDVTVGGKHEAGRQQAAAPRLTLGAPRVRVLGAAQGAGGPPRSSPAADARRGPCPAPRASGAQAPHAPQLR